MGATPYRERTSSCGKGNFFTGFSVILFTGWWVSLVPCPLQGVGISGTRFLPGGRYVRGWVCPGGGYVQGVGYVWVGMSKRGGYVQEVGTYHLPLTLGKQAGSAS